MKKLLTISAFQLFTLSAFTLKAESIDWTLAANNIGKEITVTGTVKHVNSLPSGMTFLNFADRNASPNFTAVSKPGTAEADHLKTFQGKNVAVTGTIEDYKGSPQIVLKSADSIRLAEAGTDTPPQDNTKPTPQPPPPVPSTQPTITTVDVPLKRDEIRAAGKTSTGVVPETANIAFSFPKNFQTSRNQTALLVFTDFIHDKDLEKLLSSYVKLAHSKGWPVITARGPDLEFKLPPEWHSTMFKAAFRHLKTDHPDIENWSFYTAGVADGAHRATVATPYFLRDDIDVKGMFLVSLQFSNFDTSVKKTGISASKLRDLKTFVAFGEKSTKILLSDSLAQAESIRKLKVKEVLHVTDAGRGSLRPETLEKGLNWLTTN
jgi:hypothetical protein